MNPVDQWLFIGGAPGLEAAQWQRVLDSVAVSLGVALGAQLDRVGQAQLGEGFCAEVGYRGAGEGAVRWRGVLSCELAGGPQVSAALFPFLFGQRVRPAGGGELVGAVYAQNGDAGVWRLRGWEIGPVRSPLGAANDPWSVD